MIRKIHAGRSYLREIASGHVDTPDPQRADSAHWRSIFSERETFILRQIVLGRTSRQIGALLHRSPRTIDKQRESLRIKLDIHNTAALVAFGVLYLQDLDLAGDLPEAPLAP